VPTVFFGYKMIYDQIQQLKPASGRLFLWNKKNRSILLKSGKPK